MSKRLKYTMNVIISIMKPDKNVTAYLNSQNKLRPFFISLRVAIIYGVLGSLWILFSDKLLALLRLEPETRLAYELYKGWFYVFITTLLIFYLILKNLLLFEGALKKLWQNYEELNIAHAELLTLKEELSYLAYTDALTGLPNKIAFEIRMKHMIETNENQNFALVYMDIDNFKNINNTLGHDVGDQVLVEISRILEQEVEKPDFVYRISGDEFAIIYTNVGSHQVIDEKMNYLIKKIRKPWNISGQEFFITYSMGITIHPEDGVNRNILLRNAETTMHSVKKVSKDRYAYYSKDILEQNIRRVEMVNELRSAINKEEFVLLYQPIRHLKRDCIEGVEALIRWNHPTKGFVSPMEFIPLAEESGLIYGIDKWVLKTAFHQKKEWEDKGYPHLKMSVNVSGKGLITNGLVEEISELLQKTQVNSKEIQIEVTETVLMENIEVSAKILQDLRTMGIKIALDDFGTGYSSLTYLEKLPIDVVKLDRQFIQDMIEYEQVNLIVKTIIHLTHDLVLEIVAEGIETNSQLEYLILNKCDYGQGYLFSRPVSKEEIEKEWSVT